MRSQNGQQRLDGKRSLKILVELTGNPLPLSVPLNKELVCMEPHAPLHQGSCCDKIVGTYFTGEKVAIKVFRQSVDKATVSSTQRVRLSFSSLSLARVTCFE
jgi:hypothetical protein